MGKNGESKVYRCLRFASTHPEKYLCTDWFEQWNRLILPIDGSRNISFPPRKRNLEVHTLSYYVEDTRAEPQLLHTLHSAVSSSSSKLHVRDENTEWPMCDVHNEDLSVDVNKKRENHGEIVCSRVSVWLRDAHGSWGLGHFSCPISSISSVILDVLFFLTQVGISPPSPLPEYFANLCHLESSI